MKNKGDIDITQLVFFVGAILVIALFVLMSWGSISQAITNAYALNSKMAGAQIAAIVNIGQDAPDGFEYALEIPNGLEIEMRPTYISIKRGSSAGGYATYFTDTGADKINILCGNDGKIEIYGGFGKSILFKKQNGKLNICDPSTCDRC